MIGGGSYRNSQSHRNAMPTTAQSSEDACRTASWPAQSSIHYPGSAAFTEATVRWNAYGAPSYCAAVSPSNAEEVASIVKVANAAGIPFLATGGRHHYGTTLQRLQNGLAIDLSRLNVVTVDRSSSTATIGGGAKIRDVLKTVSEAGYQIPSGACNSAGYIGSGLGAGVGYLEGTFSLVIDSLVSAKLVTASGDVIQVSDSSHSDLFWAIRGAGANFGIITSAVFKLSQPVNNGNVFYADLVYGASQKSEYFNAIQTLINDDMPSQLGFSTTLSWNASKNETGILTSLIYVGTETEARKRLAVFFELNPVVFAAKVIPFAQVPNVLRMGATDASCNTTGGMRSILTVNVRQFVAETHLSVFDKFDDFMKQYPDSRSSALIFETFSNHATLTVPNEKTAYPWRDARGNYMLQLRRTNLDNPFGASVNDFAKELRADLVASSGYPELSAYVSYTYGDETLEQKFGRDKLPRLIELKKKWDPENVFGYCNPLPTHYQPS
ncbi:FAD-binding domain-containing protein [Xylaria palmicola]|nr:FAD-binding domain-containing protein [Xylaria palmicola]